MSRSDAQDRDRTPGSERGSGDLRWIQGVLLLGAVYFVVGASLPVLARAVASDHARVALRLAAWIACAAAFAMHVGDERIRLRSSPATSALHAASAVALGAFALAATAIAHAIAAHLEPRNSRALALILWPVAAAVPAFVVALGATLAASRLRRKRRRP